jgi:SAM-dependent methyltransferase
VAEWSWDETLYAGSAEHYARGRVPYPPLLAEALRDELALDGGGRLLDVGCGPGPLTRLLAPLFDEAVGIDADAEMVRVAAREAPPNARFVHLRAEDLPAGLGMFRVAALAQSFHWLEGERVARTLYRMLEPDGALVHVGATTDQGEGDVPRAEIGELVRAYLGPLRRAGRGVLPSGTRSDERERVAGVGFGEPLALELDWRETFERSEDEVVASVFSLSSAAPHLFGERLPAFERDLRALLRRASPAGRFHETTAGVGVLIWRRGRGDRG